SKLLRWSTAPGLTTLAVENPSYEGLTHRRTVWFVDDRFFVILDEAEGEAAGRAAVHYHLIECDPDEQAAACAVTKRFDDGNDNALRVFGPRGTTMERREGWVARTYRNRNPRPSYAFAAQKRAGEPVRFVTVLLPGIDGAAAPRIDASIRNGKVLVKIGKTRYELEY
ncbi:MAG: heparinase II/III-family protein, partial [Alistipes sp.]|nr:heparinase II/III-family protein [Alistipes sp.]